MRLRWTDFSRGLWIVGPREANPEGTLRRAKGVAPLRSVSLRSRSGTLGYFTLDAHSMTRFNDEYIIGAGTSLFKSVLRAIGSEVVIPAPVAGGPATLDGTRLTFVQMSPTSDVDLTVNSIPQHLFVAGGGSLLKLDPSFGDGAPVGPTRWGIQPPDYTNQANPDVTLALATQQNLIIDSLTDINDAASDWNDTGDDIIDTFANDATRFTEGTASMRLEIGKDDSVEVTRDINVAGDAFFPALNLSQFPGPITSFNEDFISFDVRINRPKHIKSIGITFFIGTTNDKFFSRDLKVQIVSKNTRKRLQALGDILKGTTLKSKQRERDFVVDMQDQVKDRSTAEFITEDTVSVSRRRWTRVTISKATFQASGDLTQDNANWADVRKIKFSVETNKLGKANVNFDRLFMFGGTGMQGDYQYHFTFKNNSTGTRSNPDLTTGPRTVADVHRQGVLITNIPQTPVSGVADPQVDKIEIWRTIGSGEIFFKNQEVNFGVTSVTDQVADYIGMAQGATSILDTEELPLDNTAPENTYEDAVGPHVGRMWWGRDTVAGAKGRVYFSPESRAEAVDSFTNVSTDEDPVQKLVIWNQQLWAFTEKHVYRIDGDDEPFIAVEIFGCAGTLQPFTVVPTPDGIYYRAFDGIRLFRGGNSQLVAIDAIAPILRNSTTDGLTDFVGDYSAWGRGEYYITDSRDDVNTTLAVSTETGAWRNLGFANNFLYYDSEANILFGRNIPATIASMWSTRLNSAGSNFAVGNTSQYLAIGAAASPAVGKGTIGDAQFRAPRALTITTMYVRLLAALTGSQTLNGRINVNGTAGTSIDVVHNVGTGTLAFDTGSVVVAQDDLVCIEFVFGGGLTTVNINSVTIAYDILPE